jgi:cytochrome P450/NADPH-cytochrome P450 reductase
MLLRIEPAAREYHRAEGRQHEERSVSEQPHLEPIPQPPPYPVIGNLLDVRGEVPILNLMKLAETYGPIYRLGLGGRSMVVLSSFELVDQVCDNERFDKFLGPAIKSARAVAGDGLFTAWTDEPNWRKAHNILTPAFGSMAIRSYLPEMGDIAMQLVDKWARLNPDEEIDVAADMTRLTLDTIGLCAFDYRFNSFYSERPHPFVAAMVESLSYATSNLSRLPIQRKLMIRAKRRQQDNISTMNRLVDDVIARRQGDPNQSKKTDLLQAMLSGVDRQSGEKLDIINVRYQVLTFLIAGHETTSGLLTFALFYLMRNPEALGRGYAEVDAVLGGDLSKPPGEEEVRRLRYVSQILSEALRLWPTAPAFTRHAFETTALAGKYEVTPEDALTTLVPMLHRDPAIWGPDPEKFDPTRFEPELVKTRPANAYKPFGTGFRACIGRHFALQEATVALAMILQRFELLDHTGYELKLKQTLTIKPEDFRIKVRARTDRPAVHARAVPAARDIEEEEQAEAEPVIRARAPLLILYGSNTGTSEAIARQIAEDATIRGFSPTVGELDAYVGRLPTDGAVVIVTASYNGTPTDNAARFVEWATSGSLAPNALAGVRFTVFGCGDHDWADTFQRIPRQIDTELEAHGAKRIHPRGEGDQSDDMDGQFRGWYGGLFESLATALGAVSVEPEDVVKGHRYEVEILAEPTAADALIAEFGARRLVVAENRELHVKTGPKPSERSTRHVVFKLPQDLPYREGDHLGVLPRNGPAQIDRVLARFGLAKDAHVKIRSNAMGRPFLPVDRPVALSLLLAGYLALQDVAKRSDIEVLAEYTEVPAEKAALAAFCGDDPGSIARYREHVLAKNVSLIDLLEEFPSCALPFNIFVELAPPLKPRYYSISSSPLAAPSELSITVAVVEGKAHSGRGAYRGVASGYLADLAPGAGVECFVRRPSVPFFPPAKSATPMIMVGAGTGVAPYRGFLQARAAMKARGEDVGEAMLFHGCRHPAQDHIYSDEFTAFARDGVVELEPAYSRPDGGDKCYVQHRIAARRDRVWDLIARDAVVYVCGDATTLAPAVEQAFMEIHRAKNSGGDAKAWLASMKADKRYVVDIWPKN